MPAHPLEVPGLVCFWNFQEPAGKPRVAEGPEPYELAEMNGPIARAGEGLFGPFAAELKEGQWFNLPRAACPGLNLRGPKAQVSVVAWIKRATCANVHCEFIAGQWNETRAKRQYGLFLNIGLHGNRNQVCGHVSNVGGPTPGCKYCEDLSINATPVPYDLWQCVAFTYDAASARSYLNGVFEPRERWNPYAYPGGLFDGGADGSDFTVGAVDRSGEMGNWFAGVLGGLAVYRRALHADELSNLTRI
ncbi:MAG: LamG domain-containing protein [Planctomycetota bacterium]|nr:LamG domain-containing protein [Planctomycetota bacterium]